MPVATNLPFLTNTMDMNFERETCIDNMADTLFDVMQKAMNEERHGDAIAICEEWLIDGKDPQDSDTEFTFIKNYAIWQ